MKKFLGAVLIIIIISSLSACKKDQNSIFGYLSDNNTTYNPATGSTPNISDSNKPEKSSDQDIESLDNKKVGWGQGNILDQQKRPTSCLKSREQYGKYDAIFINDNSKKICLTFDEGYENGCTSSILDTLKQKNVHAVFFVTYEYAKKNDDLIKRMIDEGHVVGNHTYSHPSMPEISTEKAKQEILKLDEYVNENFGYKMTLFRPPMGEFSQRTLALTQSLGYKSVFWSFAYADWDPDKQPDPAKSLDKIIDRAHEGAIYLLHAVSKTNTEILGPAIDGLKQKGFEFDVDL